MSRRSLLLGTSAAISCAQPAIAQVAPTEVNEEAVDEFGLERKTGRFTWSTGEVIGIGSEESRIGVSVTGVRNPPRATTIWPAPFTLLHLSEPRLLSEPLPDPKSPIPGAITPNSFNHTVETPTSSETFKCSTTCYSEYLTGSLFEVTPTGYSYTDTQGVIVHFEEYSTTVIYPDGRQTTRQSGQYWKNSFGFMLKFSDSIQAVNQSVDYCDESSSVACSNLTEIRTANFERPSVGIEHIVDSLGLVTKLRWEEKTAKLFERPQGASPQLQIPDAIERYPLGITLPGSVSEDITITYEDHDPSLDTHDKIVVSSITKNGVTATYSYQRVYPQGFPEGEPSAAEAIDAITSTGGLLETYDFYCLTGSQFACSDAENLRALLVTLEELAVQQTLAAAPADPFQSAHGANILEMTISSQVAGEDTGSSFVVRPAAGFANTRRRLIYVTDAIGRKTSYSQNQFEETAGITLPDGNGTLNAYDGRGNIVSSSQIPKEDSSEPTLTTTLTYPSNCENIPLARCNKPLSITDPKGNTTDFTYNDRGQVLTEQGPPPTTGSARPTTINEYTMRQAYIKDASGNPTPAGPQISLLTKTFSCISNATCDASTPAADKVVTEYDYGPTTGLNNLLLRGMSVTAANEQGQIETLTTCYGYNYFGERISETLPAANLTSCPA